MCRRIAVTALALTFLALLCVQPAQAADDILRLVPDSALGFVVVNGPGAVDAKLQELGRQMQLPIPSLLARLRADVVIEKGLDEKGAAALLILPPEGNGPWPTPILLVPVSDFGKFPAQFQSDLNEGVAKITLWGTEVVARKIGGYLALTDESHKETLTKTLKLSEAVPGTLAPWVAWQAENDVAAVIFQPGIKLISAKVQEGIQMLKLTMARGDEQTQQAAAVFDLYAKLFQAAQKEVASVGYGVRLDKQGVLHIAKRGRLVPGGSWARSAAQVQPANQNLVAGLPTGPFVVAGGGTLPEGVQDAMMGFSMDVMKAMPNLYGLNQQQIDQMRKISLEAMKRVRSMSMVLGVGPSGASPYSKFVIIMRVDNTAAFMADYEKSLDEYRELLKKADSPVLRPIEVTKSEIGGVPAMQFTTEAPKLPAAQQTPQVAKMMEAMFGPSGKLAGWVVPADEHSVVMSYASKELVQSAAQAIKQGSKGLAGDPEVAKTAALLPANSPFVVFWSPQGTIDFVNRLIPQLAPGGAQAAVRIPEFPKTPPIGIAVTAAPDELQSHLVVPADVFKAIGSYAGKIKSKGPSGDTKVSQKRQPVWGQVTIDGQPAARGGQIVFAAPAKPGSNVFTLKSKAHVLPIKDGKFEGRLEPGQYRVSVRAPSIPQKYGKSETSGLSVETKEGSNQFDFDLTSD